MEQLYVSYRQQIVGVISQTASGLMDFRYAGGWSASSAAFPISLSLPLNGKFSVEAGHHFFANLLPEGNVREQICRSLKISTNNDFELLKAIGGDCAGALAVTASDALDSTLSLPRFESVSDEQLALWSVGTPDAFSAVTGQNEVRLSLAGAQDKLPVCVASGQILIPMGSTPSTHILKFASPYYSHLPENETFLTLLASEVGLPVVDISLRKTANAPVALITRYDRRFSEGHFIRMHQEDFCQALGISSSRKYEKEGGPSIKQCVEIVRRHTAYPLVDLQKLLHWMLFNLIVGNADAHGKNLSLLYDSTGWPRLAPFYDLVCTRNYKKISREMAMNYGGVWDPDLVSAKHIEGLAMDFGFRSSLVMEQVNSLVDKVSNGLPVAVDKYAQRFGDSPIIECVPIVIRKLIRRLRAQLK